MTANKTLNTAISVVNATVGKNRIINGDMRIDQRNVGGSVTPSNQQYLVDRWFYNTNQVSKMSFQQNAGSVTPPPGFSNYLGATVLSAVSVGTSDYVSFAQKLEGYTVSDLAFGTSSAKPVTLSFWVYSSLTGTFGGTLQQFNGSGGSSYRSYPYTYSIPVANTWTYITITIPGDTSNPSTGAHDKTNGVAFMLWFSLGVGSTYTAAAGSWQSGNYINATGATSVVGTNGATFYITGVQLEQGSSATPFERRPYGLELSLCQRYFCKTFPMATAPAQNAGTSGAILQQSSGSNSAFGTQFQWRFPVPMRASPTTTTYNPSAAANTFRNLALNTNLSTGSSIIGINELSWQAVCQDTASTAGQQIAIHVTADAEL